MIVDAEISSFRTNVSANHGNFGGKLAERSALHKEWPEGRYHFSRREFCTRVLLYIRYLLVILAPLFALPGRMKKTEVKKDNLNPKWKKVTLLASYADAWHRSVNAQWISENLVSRSQTPPYARLGEPVLPNHFRIANTWKNNCRNCLKNWYISSWNLKLDVYRFWAKQIALKLRLYEYYLR